MVNMRDRMHIEDAVKRLFWISILLVLIISLPLSVVNAEKGKSYPEISEKEVLETLKAGKSIEGKHIKGEFLRTALEEGLDILVGNCVIEGDLDLTKVGKQTLSEIEAELPREIFDELRTKYGPDLPMFVTSIRIFSSEITGSLVACTRGYAGPYPNIIFTDYSFAGTTFKERACFSGAVFKNPMAPSWGFQETIFEGGADFWGAIFIQAADFWGAEIRKEANFRGATFRGITIFHGTIFENANFSGSAFTEPVDFTYSGFEGDIDMSEMNVNKIYIIWDQIKGGKLKHYYGEFDGQVYLRLIKNFKELEQFEDANNAYYEYRVLKRRNEKTWYDPTRFLEWLFLDLSCGYGVRPFRTILYGGGIILLFTLAFYQTGAIQKRRTEKEQEGHSRKSRFMDALYFSINTFTTVGYGDWYPTKETLRINLPYPRVKRNPIGWVEVPLFIRFRTLAMIEGVLGWLIMTLFLVTLAKVWIS